MVSHCVTCHGKKKLFLACCRTSRCRNDPSVETFLYFNPQKRSLTTRTIDARRLIHGARKNYTTRTPLNPEPSTLGNFSSLLEKAKDEIAISLGCDPAYAASVALALNQTNPGASTGSAPSCVPPPPSGPASSGEPGAADAPPPTTDPKTTAAKSRSHRDNNPATDKQGNPSKKARAPKPFVPRLNSAYHIIHCSPQNKSCRNLPRN